MLPEVVVGLPQIEREIVSQFAVSPMYARNELESLLGMLCRMAVKTVAACQTEADIGVAFIVLAVCTVFPGIGEQGLPIFYVLCYTAYEACAPFVVVVQLNYTRWVLRSHSFFLLANTYCSSAHSKACEAMILFAFVKFFDIMVASYCKEVQSMCTAVSYKKLFKLMIDRDMKKKDLQQAAGLSPATITKLGNNSYVSMEVLVKICQTLGVDIGDIMEIALAENKNKADIEKE